MLWKANFTIDPWGQWPIETLESFSTHSWAHHCILIITVVFQLDSLSPDLWSLSQLPHLFLCSQSLLSMSRCLPEASWHYKCIFGEANGSWRGIEDTHQWTNPLTSFTAKCDVRSEAWSERVGHWERAWKDLSLFSFASWCPARRTFSSVMLLALEPGDYALKRLQTEWKQTSLLSRSVGYFVPAPKR